MATAGDLGFTDNFGGRWWFRIWEKVSQDSYPERSLLDFSTSNC